MIRPFVPVRLITAGLLVLLGLVIVGRGLLEAGPLAYTGMGVAMAGLGMYRLKLLLRLSEKDR
jgi:hypothetical protein